MERKSPVYHYMLIDQKLRAVSPHHAQASVYVACATQKRAAELFTTTVHEMQLHGGTTGQTPVQEMCWAEPEVVFVEVSHGVYIRMTDLPDLSKSITLDMKDEDLYGREIESPAFGMISASRISGETNLFGVDYPQGHFIRLTISTARLNRNGGTDRVMSRDDLISVDMSEVQWARMIASPNTSGVSCTLSRYIDPKTGDFLTPRLPDKHVADKETFKDDVKDRATKAMAAVGDAQTMLASILKGGPLRKGDLQEVLSLLETGNRQMVANVPYMMERAHETIEEATENAKTEVGAYVDFAMQKLGERALGDRVMEALAAGADLGAIGRQVAEAVITVPALEDRSDD